MPGVMIVTPVMTPSSKIAVTSAGVSTAGGRWSASSIVTSGVIYPEPGLVTVTTATEHVGSGLNAQLP